MISVLMVCAGNYCRSPMAEAIFRQLVHEADLDHQIQVESAGTDQYHVGSHPHRGTQRILEQHGIYDPDKRSRQITQDDLQSFDYVIVMDDANLADIKYFGGSRARVARLLDFAPEQPVREVPDPYYSGGFDTVYDLSLIGSRGLLAQIRADHNLRGGS